jgi:hypothetical protein
MKHADRGWIVCIFVMSWVGIFSVALLYSIFADKGKAAVATSGGLDGLFGWCLRTIIKFHFPPKDKSVVQRLVDKVVGANDE